MEDARESPPPGEEEATAQLIDMLRAKMLRERVAPERVQRDAHPKSHGLVKANFIGNPSMSQNKSLLPNQPTVFLK